LIAGQCHHRNSSRSCCRRPDVVEELDSTTGEAWAAMPIARPQWRFGDRGVEDAIVANSSAVRASATPPLARTVLTRRGGNVGDVLAERDPRGPSRRAVRLMARPSTSCFARACEVGGGQIDVHEAPLRRGALSGFARALLVAACSLGVDLAAIARIGVGGDALATNATSSIGS
jgi:hypothetical protein